MIKALEVGVVGSGSNLLVADEAVRGPVLELDQDLTDVDVDGTRSNCGAAVPMNADAHRGESARAMDWTRS